jgi:hypothetical protein
MVLPLDPNLLALQELEEVEHLDRIYLANQNFYRLQ